MSHTPGPWNVMPSKRSGLLHVETDATAPEAGVAICSLVGAGNARLIAAAPELLKALEVLVETFPCQNGCKPDDMNCATMRARAAIKKAKGL